VTPDRSAFEFVVAADHIRARPPDSAAEPILLPSGWADGTSTDGTWTDAVDAVVPAIVTGPSTSTSPTARDDTLVVDQRVIRDALSRTGIVSADAAEAASAYLAESGILPADDGTATVVEAGEDSTAGVYRWASLCDALADAIAERAERLRGAVERGRGDPDRRDEEIARLKQERAERREEILDLAGDVDGSIEGALSSDELERFKRLREEYHHYDAMLETSSRGASPLSIEPMETIDRAAAALHVTADRLSRRAGVLRTAAEEAATEVPGADAVAAAETAIEILRGEGDVTDPEPVHRLVASGHRLAVADT